MMTKSKALKAGIVAIVFSLLGCGGQTKAHDKKTPPKLKEQLGVFLELGFRLNNGIALSDINRWESGEKAFEDQSFQLLYKTLGQTIEREPWTPITNQCWDFDPEAIEDDGDYVSILKNISRISNGDLVFEDINDSISIEEKAAWVSFSINGVRYKWDLKVNNDWVDEELFIKIQELASNLKAKGRLTIFDTGEQGFILGYHAENELKTLKQRTGLKIEWFKISQWR